MRIILPACQWNFATDDLDWGEFGRKCIRWAQDYERAGLPKNLVFPQANQIWEAVRECEVNFNAFFSAWPEGKPFMVHGEPLPFGRARLASGERVRIETMNEPEPMMIWFTPLRSLELQPQIVPEGVLGMPHYNYYTLSLKLARSSRSVLAEPPQIYFSEAFRLIEGVNS